MKEIDVMTITITMPGWPDPIAILCVDKKGVVNCKTVKAISNESFMRIFDGATATCSAAADNFAKKVFKVEKR